MVRQAVVNQSTAGPRTPPATPSGTPSAEAVEADAGPRPTAAVRGRVLDEAHQPVTSFRIGDVEVETKDGRFVVPVKGEGGHLILTFEAPQLATATLIRPADTADLGDVVLHPAPAVRGVVREADGCRGERTGERRLTARTDASGHFTLYVTATSGVLVRLVAMKDDRLGWAEAGRVGEAPQLTLAGPTPVRGRVLGPLGQPVPRVAVVFFEPLLQPVSFVTGVDGGFSGNLPPGLYRVTLSPDASQPPRTWTVQLPMDHPLVLKTEATPQRGL
jgi:hypothetical protein